METHAGFGGVVVITELGTEFWNTHALTSDCSWYAHTLSTDPLFIGVRASLLTTQGALIVEGRSRAHLAGSPDKKAPRNTLALSFGVDLTCETNYPALLFTWIVCLALGTHCALPFDSIEALLALAVTGSPYLIRRAPG